MTQPPNNRSLRLEIPPNLTAIYSNAAIVNQTTSEIIIDFLQILPNDPRARVQSRVVMTPTNAKLFLKALETNLARFEEHYGEIVVPPQNGSLADQLFGTIKPEGEPPNE
ncbi:MAG: DUF3467 domain-containing protein [Chloroflexi bacterium]|nr:DUF3467 domain-containing protein [Chloroflexota bacterium]